MRKAIAVALAILVLTIVAFYVLRPSDKPQSHDIDDVKSRAARSGIHDRGSESSLQMTNELCQRGGGERKWGNQTSKQFGHRLVHLDLKGAPPTMKYLIQLLPLFKSLGATGLLVEYEDTYPYVGDLKVLHGAVVYTEEEVVEFLKQANNHGLDVVPLVQTFGHLEFVLKHEKFKEIRATPDNPMSLCSMNKGSLPLVKALIEDIMRLHANAKFIHLGGDEVYNLGECELDKKSKLNKNELYLQHMKPVLEFTKNKFPAVRPLIWHDMLSHWSEEQLKEVVSLVEPMVWEYRPHVEKFVSEDALKRFSNVFRRIWAASAFKGASSHVADYVPITERIQNHVSWSKILRSFPGPGKLVGIALTGWSRFDHFATYCELLPAGVPSLGLCLATLKSGYLTEPAHRRISQQLGIRYPIPLDRTDALTFYDDDITGDSAFLGFEVYRLSLTLVQAQHLLEVGIEVDQCWSSLWSVEHHFVNLYKLQSAREVLAG